VREILEKFAEQLQANPVYCDLDGWERVSLGSHFKSFDQ
jgi:hypothetical protein